MGSYWSSFSTNNTTTEFNDLIIRTCESGIRVGQGTAFLTIENMPPNKVTLLKSVLKAQGFDIGTDGSTGFEISGWSKKLNTSSKLMVEQFKKKFRDATYGPRLEFLKDQFKRHAESYGHDQYYDKHVEPAYGEEMSIMLQSLGYRSVYDPEKKWILTKWDENPIPSLVEKELHEWLKSFEIVSQDQVNSTFELMKHNVEEKGYDSWKTSMPNSQGYARLVINKFEALREYNIHPYCYREVFEAAASGGVPPEKIEDPQPYYLHGFCVSHISKVTRL